MLLQCQIDILHLPEFPIGSEADHVEVYGTNKYIAGKYCKHDAFAQINRNNFSRNGLVKKTAVYFKTTMYSPIRNRFPIL